MNNNQNRINTTAKKYIEHISNISDRVKPLAVIHCLAYNHEKYLRDALEGFLMQQTSFPFVAIVHDDASTDGTAQVLREYADNYPDIILPIFEKHNQYSIPGDPLTRIMNRACEVTGAKYIAVCEGDDYWTDPYKLQKQVDFLESHRDYGMCYTKVKRYDQNREKFIGAWGGSNQTFREFLNENNAPTLTVVIRSDLYKSYYSTVNPQSKRWYMGDYPLNLYISLVSKVKFIDEITGVYRVLSESASHSNSIDKLLPYLQSINDVKKYFITNFDTECPDYDLEYSQLCIFMIYLPIADDKFKKLCYTQLDKCHVNRLKYVVYKLRIKSKFVNKLFLVYVGIRIKLKSLINRIHHKTSTL